jgi:hypothetical protein
MSQPLRDRKEVSATAMPGVKDGQRVFFLDICIRDSKTSYLDLDLTVYFITPISQLHPQATSSSSSCTALMGI